MTRTPDELICPLCCFEATGEDHLIAHIKNNCQELPSIEDQMLADGSISGLNGDEYDQYEELNH